MRNRLLTLTIALGSVGCRTTRGFMEKENKPPDEHHEPKRRLSLKLPEEKKSRFHHKSKEEMEVTCIAKGFVPPNMEKNTRWSKKCFMQWVYEINKLPDCSKNVQRIFSKDNHPRS